MKICTCHCHANMEGSQTQNTAAHLPSGDANADVVYSDDLLVDELVGLCQTVELDQVCVIGTVLDS